MKLIYYLLKGPEARGGCGLELSQLVFHKVIAAFYPLHDRNIATSMQEVVFKLSDTPWTLDTHQIRDYFGEKIALYFVFIGHYSWWLLIPGLIGLVFQIVVFATGNYSSPILPFFSLIITVWAITMLEYWKREEHVKALFWGMTSFEDEEPDRPEYKGATIVSFIDGDEMTYFPPTEVVSRFVNSQGVIACFVFMVIGVVTSIYVLRFSLQSSVGSSASTIASILNTIQITVFNLIYRAAALMLTDSENHRTDTQYEDALIIKLFMFLFINSYASFFFLAFIASYLPPPDGSPSNFTGQCGASSCMVPLAINLAIIFGTRLVVNNVMALLLPYIKATLKFKEETKGKKLL